MSKNIIKNLHVSLLAFCQEFADKHQGMVVVNFDAHADENSMPNSDAVGISTFSVNTMDGFAYSKVLIGISTIDDENNFKLLNYVNELFDTLLPEEKITLLDSVTGESCGWMIIQDGTTMLPVGGSVVRPLQYVAISMAGGTTFR